MAQFDAQVTIRQLAVSPPGETIALVSGTGQVHAFGFQAESDGAPASITPIGQEWAEISDASAVVAASTPQPRLAIASQAQGIVLVNLADRQVTATIATEIPISCLALSADQGVLAGGDHAGKVHLWNLTDGTLLRTLEGTSETNRQKAGLNQTIERQKQEIARLQGQLPGLEQLLAAEVEVVTKASAARDEAATALANAQEEHSTSQKSLMASEEMLASAQAASMKAAEALPKLNQKAAMLAEQKGKAQQALDEVKGKADEAAQVLSEAQAKLDELQMLTTKQQEQLQQLQQQEDRLKQKIDQLQKEEQEARQRIEATQQKLETQRTEVAKKAEAVASAESLLVNREQALSASTDAKNRAEAAVPAHRTRIAAQERKLARVEERLQVRQQDLTSPAQAVYGLAWDAAGEKLATVHRTGTIRVYRVSDGRPLDAIDVPASAMPRGVAWVGQTLSSWSSRAAARRFSTTFRWELTRTIGDLHGGPIADRVTALAFHPDGLLLAIGSGIPSRTGEVVVVSADSGEVVRTFGQFHSDTVECLQFSPDGQLLASGAADKTIHLIDVADSRSVKTLEGHTHHVVALAWLAQPQQLASAAADQTLKVWNIESGQPIRTIGGLPDQPSGMSLVGATTQCLVGDIQGNLRVVDAATGQTLRSFRAPGGFMYRVATTPDGQFAFTGGKDGKARMWNVADGSQTLEIDPAATSSGADFD